MKRNKLQLERKLKMTREDVVKQLKEKAEIEIGSLKKSVMDLIFDFGGGDHISSEMTVETSDVIDDGELIGTEVIALIKAVELIMKNAWDK